MDDKAEHEPEVDEPEDYLWQMGNDGELKCQNCPEEIMNESNDENRIRINENGIDINIKDENGESFKMKIGNEEVQIKARDQEDNVDINIGGEGNQIKIEAEDGEKTITKTIIQD